MSLFKNSCFQAGKTTPLPMSKNTTGSAFSQFHLVVHINHEIKTTLIFDTGNEGHY
jgi:hypothetical protein